MATSQPFTLLALGMERSPELDALADLGHTIIYGDLILFGGQPLQITQVVGPNCWRLLPDQMKWVPLMMKEMRALQPKPKKVKKEKIT